MVELTLSDAALEDAADFSFLLGEEFLIHHVFFELFDEFGCQGGGAED